MPESPTPEPPETAAAEPASALTDDHAQALLADALAAAELENTQQATSPWDDPAAAKAEIERLRRENGANRTKAKEKAAEEARGSLAQEIGKILGLVQDDAPLDPSQLTAQLTASQTQARQAALELAVFKAASVADANPEALLDSRTFLAKVESIDPHDTGAIASAITEAIAANPLYGKQQPTTGMKPNPAQGRSSSPPPSMTEQAAAALAAGNTREAIRLKSALAIQQTT